MINNKRLMLVIVTLVLVAATITAISIGAVKISLLDMTDLEWRILLNVRIPRVLLAGLVGAALVFSGALFQYVMKNPLADSPLRP